MRFHGDSLDPPDAQIDLEVPAAPLLKGADNALII